GFAALADGNRDLASTLFAGVLWYDADNADAWFGYGLAAQDKADASGAIAFAILLYPDADTAQARRAQFEPIATQSLQRNISGIYDALPKRLEELDLVMLQASVAAERIRPRLASGTVRMAEAFAWNKR
ncbi:MAG: hypothetical protein ACREO3_09495, partial [Arenimonas sp.]